jgi:pimeloyl-ACP methyl ester carboxylesterase
LLFVLDTLPAEARRYGVRLDLSRVALVGHSLGGKLSFLAAAERPVQAVVGLDPVDAGAPGVIDPVRFPSAVSAMGSVRAPVLLLGAEYGERVKFGTPCAPPGCQFPEILRGRSWIGAGSGATGRWPHGLPRQPQLRPSV